MKNLLGGLLIAAGVAVLAVGVLAAAEVLLQNPNRRSRRSESEKKSSDVAVPEAVPQLTVEAPSPLAPKKDAARNFSIKRTKSEVGYVYWILEGYGKYKCFILCDTWDEAVEQAKAKLAEIDAAELPQAMAARA
jgi:hypothetical protein